MDNDTGAQKRYYEGLLLEHGDHFLSLDWKDPNNQKLRFRIFEELIRTIPMKKFSVLDVGCGFGDLYGHLNRAGLRFDYTGVDISEKLLEVAAKKYPKAMFEARDILTDKKNDRYDFVFCSGLFNIRFREEPDHMEFVRSMLLRMRDISKKAVGANFLSVSAVPYVAEDDLNKNQYYYFRPEDILSFCNFISCRYLLRHDYSSFDFSVYLFK
ncbi:MAG: class I SAM-dependent methyltransferase [Candidatus Margulisbacteria bacterium]|nr:class I SAM-dependent methyltransferase [Candidatus Margulisiibacteriota bacterium]